MKAGTVRALRQDFPLLQGLSQTLLLTLCARAQESQRSGAQIIDERSLEIVNKLNVNPARFRMTRVVAVSILMRQRKIDEIALSFLNTYPQARVIHIGCGLDYRFERVDNGRVEWFDVDLPEVIALRHELYPPSNGRYHALASSALEPGWMDQVEHPGPHPYLFISEGLFPYLHKTQVRALVLALQQRFTGCHLVCDHHTFLGGQIANLQLALSNVKARTHWHIQRATDLEHWGAGIHLLDEWYYPDEENLPLNVFNLVRVIPLLANSSGILHYQLGAPPGEIWKMD